MPTTVDHSTHRYAARVIPGALRHAGRGFCMGTADIIPGVSGGTIALVFGIYEQLVANVHLGARALGSAVRGDRSSAGARLREIEWSFVVPLVAGIVAALLALSSLLERLLEDYPEEMAGLFLGLVIASVIIVRGEVARWTAEAWAIAGAVGVATFVLLGFQSGPVADPTLLAFFGAGAVAICAMILPGISGSFLLLMMGMYAPVLGAVNDRHVVDLAVFVVGVGLGLALFSTLLAWLLRHQHQRLLAALIGLLVGSVRVLWPWPNGVGLIAEDESEVVDGTGLEWPGSFADFAWPTLLALAAFAAVLAIWRVSRRREPAVTAVVG